MRAGQKAGPSSALDVGSTAKLDKTLRIRRPAEYRQAFAEASRIRGHYLTLAYSASTCSEARLGLAISVKHAGNAVKRNWVKRKIREYFRRNLREYRYDLIFLSKPALAQAGRGELDNNLQYFKRKLVETNSK